MLRAMFLSKGTMALDFPNLKKIMEYQKQQREQFIELCKFLSANLQQKIILRPHPEESAGYYSNSLAGTDGVEVIAEGSVIPWIIASDVMIHHDCTTAIECAMLERNSVAYIENLNPELVTDIPLRISYKYSNQTEILEHVKRCQDMPLQRDVDILNEYFSFNVSGLDKIIDSVLEIATPSRIRRGGLVTYQVLSYFKACVRGIFKKPDKLFLQKIDGLDLESIEGVLRTYNDIESDDVVVKKVSSELFVIKQCRS